MTTAARESALEQASRALSLAKDRRLPQSVRTEAGEIASELVTVANQAGAGPQLMQAARRVLAGGRRRVA